MATKKATETEATTEAATEEKKFTIAKFQEHSYELFGVPSSTFAGATAGLEGTYTKSEIEAIIDEWNNKEAK
jgi:hypothetical protein